MLNFLSYVILWNAIPSRTLFGAGFSKPQFQFPEHNSNLLLFLFILFCFPKPRKNMFFPKPSKKILHFFMKWLIITLLLLLSRVPGGFGVIYIVWDWWRSTWHRYLVLRRIGSTARSISRLGLAAMATDAPVSTTAPQYPQPFSCPTCITALTWSPRESMPRASQ